MKTIGWLNLMGRVLLVLGLVVGPWPSALFAAPAEPNVAATQAASDESPCPAHASASTESTAVSAHCPCCGDCGPCTPDQCAASASAPGLPVRMSTLLMHPDGVDLQAALSPRPPEPRPGERLRPPIV